MQLHIYIYTHSLLCTVYIKYNLYLYVVSYCVYIYIDMSYRKFILRVYMCMYVRAYDIQNCWESETLEDSQRLTTVLASNPAAWASMLQLLLLKAAVFFGDEGICHVAVLILGDKRQDPGIMSKINVGLCPMMFLAVIEKELCLSLCAYTWRWDLSLCRLCTTQSPHFCWYLPFIVYVFLVYLPLIFNANFYILLHVVSMNHEVDSTASTPTSGRLVDLGVWVSQIISQGFDSMQTSCWILLENKKIWTSIKYGASLFWTPKWLMHHGPVLHHANGEWSTSNWGADSCR